MNLNLIMLRCPCGQEVQEEESIMNKEYGGLCEECYQSSMDAAYSDLPEVFGDN